MTYQEAVLALAVSLAREVHGEAYDVPTVSEIAAAVSDATDDPSEAETMLRIARWESGFKRSVMTCLERGDHGRAHGTWQVHPRSIEESKLTCTDVRAAARTALDRIRESYSMCSMYSGADALTGYTVGICKRAGRVTRARWGDGSRIRALLQQD